MYIVYFQLQGILLKHATKTTTKIMIKGKDDKNREYEDKDEGKYRMEIIIIII